MEIQSVSSTSINPVLERLVEGLFDEMLLNFGKKFVDQWAAADTDKLVAHWARELKGYTPREVKRGIEAQKTLDWPPTLPQFKKLCRPTIDHMIAYYEAVSGVQERANGKHGTWSHPAIYWAAMPLSYDLGIQTYSQIKTRWEMALDAQMEKGEWEEIPKPMLQIAAPGKSELSKENAAKMIEELGAVGVIKKLDGKHDPLAWAKKILEREKRGDKTITVHQINSAKEALQ